MREDAPDWTMPQTHSSLDPGPGEEWEGADVEPEDESDGDRYAERISEQASPPTRPPGSPPLTPIHVIMPDRARLARVMACLAELEEARARAAEAPEESMRRSAIALEAVVAMEKLIVELVPQRYRAAAQRWAAKAEIDELDAALEYWMAVTEPGEAESSPNSSTRGSARRSTRRSQGTRREYPW